MSKEFENLFSNEELIDNFLNKLVERNVLDVDNQEHEEMEIEVARKLLIEKISKLRNWAKRLGVKNIFSFENYEVRATPLLNTITNLNNKIRMATPKVESFITTKENQKTGKKEEVLDYDLYISSPNRTNYVEKEIIELLHGQQLFLEEVQKFLDCVNNLDQIERTIIYYHFLKVNYLPILTIKNKYAKEFSQASLYRIKNKAVLELIDNLMVA